MRNNKKIINKIIYLAMSILILLNVVGIGIKDNINKKIISQMRERTKQNPEDVYWIDDDIYNFEHIKKDQGFYINSNNELVICFDKYEVAPGSSGLVEFKIPKSVTNQLMNN